MHNFFCVGNFHNFYVRVIVIFFNNQLNIFLIQSYLNLSISVGISWHTINAHNCICNWCTCHIIAIVSATSCSTHNCDNLPLWLHISCTAEISCYPFVVMQIFIFFFCVNTATQRTYIICKATFSKKTAVCIVAIDIF